MILDAKIKETAKLEHQKYQNQILIYNGRTGTAKLK